MAFRRPKKRPADEGPSLDFTIGDMAEAVEVVVDEALALPLDSIQRVREELKEQIAQTQIQTAKMINPSRLKRRRGRRRGVV